MKQILIALDYDPSAQQIAESGVALAKAMNAQVTLLHVIADPTYYSSLDYSPIMGFNGFGLGPAVDLQGTFSELKKLSQDYLDRSKEYLGDSSIQTIVKEGDSADAILETIKTLPADIVVMGSHSRHGLDKILMGSVTENVLHKSAVPLYIIPTKKNK